MPMARNFGALVLAAMFGLSGCVSTEDDGDAPASVPDVSYQGSLNPVDIEGSNTTALTGSVLGMKTSVRVLPQGIPGTPDASVLAATTLLRTALDKRGPVVAVAGVYPLISVMEDCEDGGEIVATTEGIRLTVEYFHCAEDGTEIHGSAQRVGSDGAYTVTIHGIRLTAVGLDLGFAGTFAYLDDGAHEILTLRDIVIRDNHPQGRTLRAENLVITEADTVGGEDIIINGRLYVSAFGYVEVETADSEPLFVADGDDYPSSGLLTLTGQHDETIVVMPLSSTQVNFMVDTDGDMDAEIDETVTWTQVEAAIGLP